MNAARDHSTAQGGWYQPMSQALKGSWRGSRGARWVIDRADGLAESPLETLGRLAFLERGLPAPVSNAWVEAGGRLDPLDRTDRVGIGRGEPALGVQRPGDRAADRARRDDEEEDRDEGAPRMGMKDSHKSCERATARLRGSGVRMITGLRQVHALTFARTAVPPRPAQEVTASHRRGGLLPRMYTGRRTLNPRHPLRPAQ
jgi:hypothetical protein